MSGTSFLGVASPTGSWSSIWRCWTLSKVQHFLWQCCFHALPVRVALLACGCAVSPLCPCCGLQEESVVHLIFSCPHYFQVWKLSPLRFDFSALSFSSFQVGWRFLVHKAMVSSDFANVLSLISFCVWGIWKAQNRLVFEGVLWRPEVVVQKAVASFWEFHDARFLCSSVQPQLAGALVESWSPPPSGFVKCNFDAAFCRQSSQGGGAAVFRDL
ncbi:uncharacterized protein LOC132313917 [Cornus florida]|uniref:uncharacterized protein LOC132313917 n=1 Tax=Cornus florida TaxID=4283 RepID=UPI00289A0522|nr:uncharacterized protein LOC132313917 [Cornus florida]